MTVLDKMEGKRGRQVKRNQVAINSYKTDRAGYWVILTNCEKDAASALAAYRERSFVESQFDDMKNDLSMSRFRTHNPNPTSGLLRAHIISISIHHSVAGEPRRRYFYLFFCRFLHF